MSLEIECDGCGRELDQPGALFFGIPDRHGLSWKRHLCSGCAADVERLIETRPTRLTDDR